MGNSFFQKRGVGERLRWGYPLTAPSVTPVTKYRWTKG
jgi:hypothetical protein